MSLVTVCYNAATVVCLQQFEEKLLSMMPTAQLLTMHSNTEWRHDNVVAHDDAFTIMSHCQ